MKLWTVQRPQALDLAKKRGYLAGDGRRIWSLFRPAYNWLRQQMRLRIHGCQGHWPIWAWESKPDLRQGGLDTRGTKCVLLTLEIPAERVLLSDFQAWHFVLNGWYLPLTQQEEKLFEPGRDHYWDPKSNLTSKEKKIIATSWERIFDLKKIYQSPGFQGDRDVQAVTESVQLSEIIAIREFIAK